MRTLDPSSLPADSGVAERWRDAANEGASVPIHEPDQLRERLRGHADAAARLRAERDALAMRLSAAERQLVETERELVDTAITAEAIVSAPTPPDAALENALLEALNIAERAVRLGANYLGRDFDADRLRELRRGVPS